MADLSRERTDFEVRLREPYNHHVACMMMGAGTAAYFPLGVAPRRYLRHRIQAEPHLLYQRRKGSRVGTVWSLELKDGRGPKPKSGTLRRMLWNQGYAIAARWLPRSMRKALDATKPFASYSAYGPDSWLQAGFLHADGTEGDWDAYFSYPGAKPEGRPLFRPIVAEEASALGFPAERWHGPGPLSFAHVLPKGDVATAPIQKVP